MKPFLLSILLLSLFIASSQELHPLEPSKSHYKSLLLLSASKNPARAHLDNIRFPISQYRTEALLYVMAAPKYLNRRQVDSLKATVGFPANSSDQTLAELAFLVDWQEKRSRTQEERAAQVLAPIGYWPHLSIMEDHQLYDQNMQHLFFEGRTVLGAYCTPKNYPATAKLLEGVTTDMRIMEFSAKYHFLRPRPYQLDPGLKPLARMSSPSFASGHTLWAYIQAFTWSELLPGKRDLFLDLAYEIGESREIMGIHYPSDEEAARVLAHRMLDTMWDNPEFIEDLKQAKLEWSPSQE